MGVPLRMGISVYTFPEAPTIGFVRGRMSSSMGVRCTSTAMESILKVSYARRIDLVDVREGKDGSNGPW